MIDFDNVTMGIRSDLQSELKRLLQSEIIRGKVAVQRAYADWRRYPQYIVPLSESSIDLIFAPAYGSNKKNATDIRLAIDALELVFTRPEIGTFILLSGDSDFSSLVLKLKEYGKYVIGVGIRESSSDLLIQNCDEYYSYNELAGLTKESEVTLERRDPWELVVEAVKQMTAHNDVMRSDRLKQVMQEIDPSFNEKDAGFSRFSKFVLEAAHRGLVSLTKLDNGQYELALGPDVLGAAANPSAAREHAAPARRERQSAGTGEGNGRTRRGSGFSLGEAFGLLKQALGRLGAGEHTVTADEVRETMIEIKGGEAGPLEAERFPKLLRQAHDAEIIDLSKVDDGAYAVKLRESAAAPEVEAGPPAESVPMDDTVGAAPASPATGPGATPAGVPSRSARFRRGSRGGRVPPPEIPRIGVVEVDPNFKPRVDLTPAKRPSAEPGMAGTPTPGMGEAARGAGGFGAGRVDDARSGEREDRGARGGRGGRGGGGRGGRGSAGREGQPPRSHEGAEREGGGRSRGRRGGRGRGGRRRNGEPGSERPAERTELGDASQRTRAPFTPVPTPAPTPAPTRLAAPPAAAPADESDGESFWTKVKRGLTGGA
ncbi:MAG TPA: NYN domain-containing protein [Gemmatimonadales bacterium]|nr:NYN domain-containing protein [Gemmatimonadales bacterium]